MNFRSLIQYCLWMDFCRQMMFLTETINFGVGTALFLHAVFKVVVNYVYDTCNGKPADRLKVRTAASQGHSWQLPENLPSVVDIKRVLPKSCFDCRVSTSMYYLIKDFAQVFCTAVVYTCISKSEPVTWWSCKTI